MSGKKVARFLALRKKKIGRVPVKRLELSTHQAEWGGSMRLHEVLKGCFRPRQHYDQLESGFEGLKSCQILDTTKKKLEVYL